ncbi:uncharacterized protein BX663DRAFT_521613 [Cokeromyces recurvatus]|uniref:uncharacterized protein n=1 Tax=Cokeromyces recurvatus TaxID=90255 RepID=UPI00221FAC37|nr:uncharacterized protein BX663DRAFT_521613 [Cokeromyces recurvatus]KAI7899398.1 hypothetical protein BX663DRAFT_521613 [Cokeromyces recurvatus]
MSNQTYQQVQRLDFLFNAGHSMLSMCPSLSRYYMNEFQNTLTEYELTASKPIARLSCTSCGQILIPGLTSKTEIIPKLYNGSFKKKMPRNETMI